MIQEKIFTTENLDLAITESLKNHDKRRKAIRWVLNNRELAIKQIQENPHIVGKYKEHDKIDGMNGKIRKIKVPKYYPDQIIHHALIRVLNPIFQKSYYKYTCACIKNRGTLYASKHLRNILKHDKKGTKYNIQLDIKKYYDNVDPFILKRYILQYIKDQKVLDLFNEIIDSNNGAGIPIGNYTSQMFANIYLNEMNITPVSINYPDYKDYNNGLGGINARIGIRVAGGSTLDISNNCVSVHMPIDVDDSALSLRGGAYVPMLTLRNGAMVTNAAPGGGLQTCYFMTNGVFWSCGVGTNVIASHVWLYKKIGAPAATLTLITDADLRIDGDVNDRAYPGSDIVKLGAANRTELTAITIRKNLLKS